VGDLDLLEDVDFFVMRIASLRHNKPHQAQRAIHQLQLNSLFGQANTLFCSQVFDTPGCWTVHVVVGVVRAKSLRSHSSRWHREVTWTAVHQWHSAARSNSWPKEYVFCLCSICSFCTGLLYWDLCMLQCGCCSVNEVSQNMSYFTFCLENQYLLCRM